MSENQIGDTDLRLARRRSSQISERETRLLHGGRGSDAKKGKWKRAGTGHVPVYLRWR
jgi:hypothetical protein